MAWIQEFPSVEAAGERAEKAWRMPLGVVSPLWAVFGAAAGAGVAYWWLTQWTRTAVNLEALVVVDPAVAPSLARVEILAEPEPAIETEPEIEAHETPAVEAVLEATTPAVASEPVAAPIADTVATVADDLTQMTGIGPKLSAALAARGVTRFGQIAAWTADDLAEIDAALSLKGRAVREAWVAQAKRRAKGA